MAEKRQKTQPKSGKPATIPVPKREDVESVFKRAIHGKSSPPKK
jgi:hypothetical protein